MFWLVGVLYCFDFRIEKPSDLSKKTEMYQVVLSMYNQLKGRFVVIWFSFMRCIWWHSWFHHMEASTVPYLQLRGRGVTHLLPLQMSHSRCSSSRDEPLDGISSEQDIVFPSEITREITLVVIKCSKYTSICLTACVSVAHMQNQMLWSINWTVRFICH